MKTVTTDELKALLDKNSNLTLVNTLDSKSFEKTEIPGATNIPLDDSDFLTRVEHEAGGKDKPVVVYCSNQQCNSSEKAAEKLEKAGFTDVSRYTQGAAAWKEKVACKTTTESSC